MAFFFLTEPSCANLLYNCPVFHITELIVISKNCFPLGALIKLVEEINTEIFGIKTRLRFKPLGCLASSVVAYIARHPSM